MHLPAHAGPQHRFSLLTRRFVFQLFQLSLLVLDQCKLVNIVLCLMFGCQNPQLGANARYPQSYILLYNHVMFQACRPRLSSLRWSEKFGRGPQSYVGRPNR